MAVAEAERGEGGEVRPGGDGWTGLGEETEDEKTEHEKRAQR